MFSGDQAITKVIKINPGGKMNVCTKLHSDATSLQDTLSSQPDGGAKGG